MRLITISGKGVWRPLRLKPCPVTNDLLMGDIQNNAFCRRFALMPKCS